MQPIEQFVNRAMKCACAVLTLMVMSLSARAALAAEPTAAERATARSLAQEGYKALKAEDFETAEDRFRRADELVHAPTLMVDHARSLVGLGRLVEASELYKQVMREGVPDNAPKSWSRALSDAEKEIGAIEPRLAWLTINVTGPENPVLTMDEEEMPSAVIGVRTAADPGTHAVKVSGEGYLPREESVTLGEGEELTIDIDLEVDPDAAKKAAAAEAEGEAQVDTGVLPPPESSSKTLAYVALGVGGAGIIAGTVTGLLFLSEKSDLDKKCPENADGDRQCDQEFEDQVKRYRLWGTLSPIGFGVGLAGAGVGLALLLSGSSNPTADTAQAHVTPYIGPDAVGVVGRF